MGGYSALVLHLQHSGAARLAVGGAGRHLVPLKALLPLPPSPGNRNGGGAVGEFDDPPLSGPIYYGHVLGRYDMGSMGRVALLDTPFFHMFATPTL